MHSFLRLLPESMLKYASVVASLTVSFLISCSEPSSVAAGGPLAANDFENVDGWLADSPALATLTRAKAHSGKYSTGVSSGHDFSLGYSNTLARLAPDWPAKLTVGAWVLLPNDQAAAKLVTEIKNPDNQRASLLWEVLELAKTVKIFNQWQYVEQTITVPVTAKANSRLLVYLWRAESKEPVYLDDLQISLTSQ